MGARDVTTQETAAKPEPADDGPVPLTAAAKARAANGATPSNGNGNGASATKWRASGAKRSGRNGKATSPAKRRVHEADELLALVEAAQRTIAQPQARRPAPAGRAPEPEPDPVAAPAAGDLRANPSDPRKPPRVGLSARGRAMVDRPQPPRPLPPERRAQLLAAIARSAEELAHGDVALAPARRAGRRGKVARRVLAFGALLVPPAAVAALLMTHAAGSGLSRADAGFIAGQIVTADQRLRSQLARVAVNGTAPSAERAREANLTMRSLMIEVGGHGGAEAIGLRRALTLQRAWIDAVGSTLASPRSPLRDELAARDAAARAAIAALPGSSGRRSGGARSLLSYARSRVRATSVGTP